MFRALKMKKKWPLKVPDSYLDRKICDLREEYGIKILSDDQLMVGCCGCFDEH